MAFQMDNKDLIQMTSNGVLERLPGRKYAVLPL
jgi:hypothetical protein